MVPIMLPASWEIIDRKRKAAIDTHNCVNGSPWAESFIQYPAKGGGGVCEVECPCCEGSGWLMKPYEACPLCHGFKSTSILHARVWGEKVREPEREEIEGTTPEYRRIAKRRSTLRFPVRITKAG